MIPDTISPDTISLETNIRRVFTHTFFSGRDKISDDEIFAVIRKALWITDPRTWYSALMDYGSLALRTVPNPNIRSHHYVRQSRFEGSRRHARATVLDIVLKKTKGANFSFIQKHLYDKTELRAHSRLAQLQSILNDLGQEGFLRKINKVFKIEQKS